MRIPRLTSVASIYALIATRLLTDGSRAEAVAVFPGKQSKPLHITGTGNKFAGAGTIVAGGLYIPKNVACTVRLKDSLTDSGSDLIAGDSPTFSFQTGAEQAAWIPLEVLGLLGVPVVNGIYVATLGGAGAALILAVE